MMKLPRGCYRAVLLQGRHGRLGYSGQVCNPSVLQHTVCEKYDCTVYAVRVLAGFILAFVSRHYMKSLHEVYFQPGWLLYGSDSSLSLCCRFCRVPRFFESNSLWCMSSADALMGAAGLCKEVKGKGDLPERVVQLFQDMFVPVQGNGGECQNIEGGWQCLNELIHSSDDGTGLEKLRELGAGCESMPGVGSARHQDL